MGIVYKSSASIKFSARGQKEPSTLSVISIPAEDIHE